MMVEAMVGEVTMAKGAADACENLTCKHCAKRMRDCVVVLQLCSGPHNQLNPNRHNPDLHSQLNHKRNPNMHSQHNHKRNPNLHQLNRHNSPNNHNQRNSHKLSHNLHNRRSKIRKSGGRWIC